VPRELALNLCHLHLEVVLEHCQVVWIAIASYLALHVLEPCYECIVLNYLINLLPEELALILDTLGELRVSLHWRVFLDWRQLVRPEATVVEGLLLFQWLGRRGLGREHSHR